VSNPGEREVLEFFELLRKLESNVECTSPSKSIGDDFIQRRNAEERTPFRSDAKAVVKYAVSVEGCAKNDENMRSRWRNSSSHSVPRVPKY
jgi:hypothetical protein